MGIGSAYAPCARKKNGANAGHHSHHSTDPRRMDPRPAVRTADPPLTVNVSLRGSRSHTIP
ncbi:MAG: hypothetical protein OXI07_05290 [Gammaproteobacteria bacterium]|nr:hypothetical protein [Gammaproteobacteria bacterium]